MEQNEIVQELNRLRSRQRALVIFFFISVAVLGCIIAAEWHSMRTLAHPRTLSLRRLDIVDQNGVSRVILAAPAPPPTRFGKPGKRDGPVSGMLLVDATGTERGGYVTSDSSYSNALLTLDAQGYQTVLLLAEPTGNVLFRTWNREAKNKGSVVLGVSESGPFVNLKQNGSLLFSAPKDNPETSDPRPLFR